MRLKIDAGLAPAGNSTMPHSGSSTHVSLAGYRDKGPVQNSEDSRALLALNDRVFRPGGAVESYSPIRSFGFAIRLTLILSSYLVQVKDERAESSIGPTRWAADVLFGGSKDFFTAD